MQRPRRSQVEAESPVCSRAPPVARRSSLAKSASVPAHLEASAPAPAAGGILKRAGSSSLLGSLLRRRRPKSVSFSAETALKERARAATASGQPQRAHEVGRYRRGVLQGECSAGEAAPAPGRARQPLSEAINCCADRRNGREDPANLPLSWEEALGGPRALLGAAQDGDDELVKRIVALVNKAGLGSLDVNAVDASGRVSARSAVCRSFC